MDLVFLGIQGSGKGTQAKRIAEQFGYHVFEMGGALRAMAASGTPLGDTVKSYIDVGNLVPQEIIMDVVRDAVQKHGDHEILFDGIPRDMSQKQAFDALMEEEGRDFRCINILLSEEAAMERIRGRAAEQGRVDDADEEKVRHRMRIFREKTMPVVEEYVAQGKLVHVDGTGTMDAVTKELFNILRPQH
jgi:adenylate kinase